MKTKLLPFLAIAACALTALPLRSEFTAAKAFVTAPQTVLPLLDSTTRLDMLDYHASGMDVKSTNVLRGKSGVKSLSPQAIEIDMTEVSDYLIAVLPPKSGTDTLVAVITTMDVPERDSLEPYAHRPRVPRSRRARLAHAPRQIPCRPGNRNGALHARSLLLRPLHASAYTHQQHRKIPFIRRLRRRPSISARQASV